MIDYIERATRLIHEVYPMIRENLDNPWELKRIVKKFNQTNFRNIRVANGSARVALVGSDYVVKWDYDLENVDEIGGCENEIELYAIAEREGFAYLFAKITRVEYDGHYFYVMPRIHDIGKTEERAWYYMTHTEKVWCECHHLTDLHDENYGWVNNHIVIVDYAFQEDKVQESSDSYYDSSLT